ncbi:hypothetical protein BSKO_13321 [Bryopsis sp. KO-2023]|nr:hypothetical protein BSKO_13321 [Bryopsis sp. KO-2023]
MMRSIAAVALVAMIAVTAVDVGEAATDGSRKLMLLDRVFGKPMNGFEVGWGIGLGAEVDDIEADVELGPFGFKLDPAPPSEAKKGKGGNGGNGGNSGKAGVAKSPTPPAAAEACDKYCYPHNGVVCCLSAIEGLCVPNGEVIPGCGKDAEGEQMAQAGEYQFVYHSG